MGSPIHRPHAWKCPALADSDFHVLVELPDRGQVEAEFAGASSLLETSSMRSTASTIKWTRIDRDLCGLGLQDHRSDSGEQPCAIS